MNRVLWRGHLFDILPFDAAWNPVGVYIFSCFDYLRQVWETLYVGQTESFRDRIPWHERWVEAVGLGATNVLAMTAPTVQRAAVERALIGEFQPPLNVQLRRPPADFLQRLFSPPQGFALNR